MPYTIESWQVPIYTDRLTIYRQDERDRDSRGNSQGLRLVFSNEPCKKHDTDNYDENQSPAGQSKVNNIMTSDKADAHLSLDVRSEDCAMIVTADGRTEYFTVAGSPKHRTITKYQRLYLTTRPAPKIADGDWNG